MAIEEGIRARIHRRLEELLGTEEAAVLMASLSDPDQVATKVDLHATEERLGTRMDGLERRMDGLGQRMGGLGRRMEKLEVRVDQLEERFTLKLEASEARTGERIADLNASLLKQMRAQAATFTRSTVIARVVDHRLGRAGVRRTPRLSAPTLCTCPKGTPPRVTNPLI